MHRTSIPCRGMWRIGHLDIWMMGVARSGSNPENLRSTRVCTVHDRSVPSVSTGFLFIEEAVFDGSFADTLPISRMHRSPHDVCCVEEIPSMSKSRFILEGSVTPSHFTINAVMRAHDTQPIATAVDVGIPCLIIICSMCNKTYQPRLVTQHGT